MSSTINFDEWFLPNKERNKITAGVELELVLFDSRSKEPLNSSSTCESVLSKIRSREDCRNVYRDYYPYQLEIKTEAHDNWKDIVDETIHLYKICSKDFFSIAGVYVVPAPSITIDSNFRYCGMHMHFRYPNSSVSTYWKKAMGMYPFILSLADHLKNFETSNISTSDRMKNSPHIGMARMDENEFNKGGNNDAKFRDIILSHSVSNGDNPSRMKKPTTIEARVMDTPSLVSHYKFAVEYLMELASLIRDDNPMVSMIKENPDRTYRLVEMTRTLLSNQRYGVNKIFRMLNSQVCEDTSAYFNIPFPRQTQFEYREEQGLSADVNGFLSMATKGGWL